MNILRFAHPEYLYGLVAVPVILILFFLMITWRKRAFKRFSDSSLLAQLAPQVSKNRPALKLVLFIIAFTLIIIGLANPQIGSKYEEVKRAGVDVIIALDVSNSMKAEDIKPSRLERAKLSIARFIDKLENDRIGLIVFAGQAYVQLPITTDFNAAKLFLSTISTDMIPTQGTAIGTAIDLGMNSFVGNEKKHKVLVIITDGENHEDDAVQAAKKASEEGIIIHTIGMGSVEGGPIPVYHSGTQVDFLKDNSGSIIVTRLDQTALEQIAAEGKGIFVRASNSDDGLENIMKEISKMDKKTFESKMFTAYEDRFQYLIGTGLLILLFEFLLGNRKSKWWHRLNLFREGK
jgi:Ca-activated chloride channel family protein